MDGDGMGEVKNCSISGQFLNKNGRYDAAGEKVLLSRCAHFVLKYQRLMYFDKIHK